MIENGTYYVEKNCVIRLIFDDDYCNIVFKQGEIFIIKFGLFYGSNQLLVIGNEEYYINSIEDINENIKKLTEDEKMIMDIIK